MILDEVNGGYFTLAPSTTLVVGSSTSAIAITTTGTATYCFNGIIKTFAAITNVTPTMLPGAVVGTYNTQFPIPYLPPYSKCAMALYLDLAGNLYSSLGAIVDASQNSSPVVTPQGIAAPQSSAGAVSTISGSDLPQSITGLTPFGLIVISTGSAYALQFQSPGATPPTVSGVTNQVYLGATGITTTVYKLFTLPANGLWPSSNPSFTAST